MSTFLDAYKSSKAWLFGVWSVWRGAIALFTVLLVLGWLVWHRAGDAVQTIAERQTEIAVAVVALFVVFGLALVVTFFWVFRGVKADEDKLNSIITYCYAFIVFSLTVSLLPFIALPLIPGLYDVMAKSPIGIVAGCSRLVDEDEKSVPRELRCDVETDQWVVNIGGTTLRDPPPGPDIAIETLPYTVSIRGGLVVPLYAVVLSLMGAAVSMTRRVPEYQRRLSPGDAEYVSYDKAREGLVFQIMQVVSAPLIAVTAYYLVDPGSRSSTIVLSFVSGFSSETVLLFIRAIMEKVKPTPFAGPAKPLNIAFVPARLDFGTVPPTETARKSVAITNPGSALLIVSSLTCTGEFAVVTPVPINITPGSNGTIEIEFKPISTGSKQGQLNVIDNAPGTPRTLDLTGTGS